MGAMPAAGLLLTGGASRRMGQDKAALAATGTGETLAGRTARMLGAVTSLALEIGPGSQRPAGVVEVQRGGGPLAAVAAGRRELCRRGWDGPAVVVATDLPRLTPALLTWLAEHPSRASVVPVALGVPQPLCARYSARDLDRAVVLAGHGPAGHAGPARTAPTPCWPDRRSGQPPPGTRPPSMTSTRPPTWTGCALRR